MAPVSWPFFDASPFPRGTRGSASTFEGKRTAAIAASANDATTSKARDRPLPVAGMRLSVPPEKAVFLASFLTRSAPALEPESAVR